VAHSRVILAQFGGLFFGILHYHHFFSCNAIVLFRPPTFVGTFTSPLPFLAAVVVVVILIVIATIPRLHSALIFLEFERERDCRAAASKRPKLEEQKNQKQTKPRKQQR
jgi:hypothetical protein